MGRIYETAIRLNAVLSSTFGSSSGAAQRSLKALATESKQLTAQGRIAAREVAKINKAGGDASAAIAEQKRLADALANVTAKMKALNEAQAARARLGAAAGRVGSEVKSLVGDALKLAGVATAASYGLYKLASSTAETGIDLDKSAKRLGTTTDSLQLLRIAAKHSQVDVEDLQTGLGKLSINIGKVVSARAKGGGGGGGGLAGNVGEIQLFTGGSVGGAKAGLNDPFKRLGLSAKELAKQKPEEQLLQISGALAKLPSHAEKAAAVVAVAGKGGLALLPLLEKGPAEISKLYGDARSSGNLLSRDTIEASKKFHEAMLSTEGAIGGVKNILGAELLPVATDVLNSISKFVKENRGQIRIWARDIASWVQTKAVPAFKTIVPEVLRLASKIGELIEKGAKLAGGFDRLAIGIAAFRTVPLVKSLVDVGYALATYISKTLAATAATKGLQAAQAGGVGGGAGVAGGGKNLLGKAGAVAAAAAAGYEAGKEIDEAGNFSGRAANYFARLGDVNARGFQGGAGATVSRISDFFKKASVDTGSIEGALDMSATGISRGRAPRPLPTLRVPAPAGSGNMLQFSPTYNVGGGDRKDLERQLDEAHRKAKGDALDAFDAREAEQRRVSYSR